MWCANSLVKEMQKVETRCHALLEETADALNEDVLSLMLLAVQKADLELSIRMAIRKNLNRELNQIDAINTILRNFTQFHTIYWKFRP